MDFKGEFINVDRLNRRRMKWELFFQTIKNTMTDLTSAETNLVKDIDKHLLNAKGIFKKPNTKYKKKDISFSTGNRMKKSFGGKTKLKNNFKQTLSKSFHPDILQKDNKFDLSVVTCNNVETNFYNSTEDIYNAKRTSPRHLTTNIRGILNKENIDYENCTCPNLGSKKYAEFNNCQDIDNTELRRGDNEKLTKIKQAKKCVNQIANSLKKLKQNSNSCNNRSVQSSECNNLHPYQGSHPNDSYKPPKIFRRKIMIEKDTNDKPNKNENVFVTLKYNTNAIDNQSFRSNTDSKKENEESIKVPTDNALKVPFVLLTRLEHIKQFETCNKNYISGNCKKNLFSNPNSSIKLSSTLEGIEEITDADKVITLSNRKEDIFLNPNKDSETSVVIKSNDKDVTILNCTENIFSSPNKIPNVAQVKLKKMKKNNSHHKEITHLNGKENEHLNGKWEVISNNCKEYTFLSPNKIPNISPVKLKKVKESNSDNKGITHLSGKENDHLIGKLQGVNNNCKENVFLSPTKIPIVLLAKLKKMKKNNSQHKEITDLNGKENEYVNGKRQVISNNCKEDTFLSLNKIPNISPVKLENMKENNTDNKRITRSSGKENDYLNRKRQAIDNNCKEDAFLNPNKIPIVSPAKLKKMKKNKCQHKEITDLNGKENEHVNGKRQVISNNCKEDTFLSPNKIPNISPVKLEKMKENNSDNKRITRLSRKKNAYLNGKRQAINNSCKEDTFSSPNKIPSVSPVKLNKMKKNNSRHKEITLLNGKEKEHVNGKRQAINNNCKEDAFLSPNKIPSLSLAKLNKMKKNNTDHKEITLLNGKKKEHVNGKRQAISNNCKEDTFSSPNKSPVKLEKTKENNNDDKEITRLSGKDNHDLNRKRQVISNNCKEDTCSSPNKIPNISPVKLDKMKENNSDDTGITYLSGKENDHINRKQKEIRNSNSKQIESNKTKMPLLSIIQNISFREVNSDFDILKNDGKFCISTMDKNYIKLYSKQINGSGQYNEILEIVDFVQRQSPLITKYILGMQVMESLGETCSDRYNTLLKYVKKQVTIIAKTLKREHFETYIKFMLWQYEKRRKT